MSQRKEEKKLIRGKRLFERWPRVAWNRGLKFSASQGKEAAGLISKYANEVYKDIDESLEGSSLDL